MAITIGSMVKVCSKCGAEKYQQPSGVWKCRPCESAYKKKYKAATARRDLKRRETCTRCGKKKTLTKTGFRCKPCDNLQRLNQRAAKRELELQAELEARQNLPKPVCGQCGNTKTLVVPEGFYECVQCRQAYAATIQRPWEQFGLTPARYYLRKQILEANRQ